VEFTWDLRKNRVNARKHGISFETVMSVFDDPLHVTVQDREIDGEIRWQTIGMANDLQVLIVAHTVEDEGQEEEVIRILSARKATRQERRIYAQG
jgi:uncharacterized DUF497 family protein